MKNTLAGFIFLMLIVLVLNGIYLLTQPDNILYNELWGLISSVQVSQDTNVFSQAITYVGFGLEFFIVFFQLILFTPAIYTGWWMFIYVLFWLPILVKLLYGAYEGLRGISSAG